MQDNLTGSVDRRELNTPTPKKTKIRDIQKEATVHLQGILVTLGIDRPTTFDQIVTYMIDDVEAAADPLEYHSGDFDIAFRRYLEKDFEG